MTAAGSLLQWNPIFLPHADRPMHVAFFASTGTGNLETAFKVELVHPKLVHIGVIVTDRLDAPAIGRAGRRGRVCIVRDFAGTCGRPGDEDYLRMGERLHDGVLDALYAYEQRAGWPVDIAVLAYRRIIRGRLLEHFKGRMINQHPSDLAVLTYGRRAYTGIPGLERALRAGERTTRTSTNLVREGVDDGEILARGPPVEFHGDPNDAGARWCHEQLQKRCSDVASLRFTLLALAHGYLGLSTRKVHADGNRIVCYKGKALPYGGVDLAHPIRPTFRHVP
jgi:phosphoribosylglycinamide formyltransferase 1